MDKFTTFDLEQINLFIQIFENDDTFEQKAEEHMKNAYDTYNGIAN